MGARVARTTRSSAGRFEVPDVGSKLAVVLAGCVLAACSRLSFGERGSADASPADSSKGGPSASAAPGPSERSRPVGRALGPAAPSRDHYVEVTVGPVGPSPHGNVVLLMAPDKKSAVPVFIGESEALSIKLRLAHKSYARPLTHDLLDAMVRDLGGKLEQVRVERIDKGAYVATVVLLRGDRRSEFDARTSDAIALALGNDVPVLMRDDVLRDAAVNLEQLTPTVPDDEDHAQPAEQQGVEM